VAPGFIDMMGGSSLPLLRDPASAESKLRQGITTMMVGEGESLAPQTAATIKDLFEGPDVPLRWQTYGEYFRLLEKKGIGLKVVHNVGAAQVRRVVLGDEDRAPTPGQLARMKDLVEQAMNDGAVGLSTALIYPPGAYARTEEIIELAKVAARRGGIYFSHMRNESKQLLEAIEETIRIGKEAQIPVHIYHLKAAGEENWPLMGKALKRMREAREQGIDITADIYPYDRNGIGLRAFIHPRHYAQGAEAFLATLSRADVRKAIEEEMETTGDWENWFRHVGKNWDNVLIASTGPRGDPTLNGLSIGEAAARRNVRPWDLFFDLVQESDAFVCPRSMDEEQKRLALGAPFVAIDTDAAPINPASVATGLAQSFHPRALGTFPRVLARYVREEKVLPLEEAIRRMSSLAANRLKLLDRGRIAPGMKADVVIFDANRIQDTATFTRPLSYPEGIEYVLVNGKLAIDGAKATGVLAGTVIRNRR
jgi:N-acyl-D-aspartate/D-glutamate deacylase